MCLYFRKLSKVQDRYEQSDRDLHALSHQDVHEHVARLPGRFCSALSQHRIIPLIWSHFAWLHPGRLPVGVQRGRQLDGRSLPLIGWQDAGRVGHWVDPLSLCSLVTWPLLVNGLHIRPHWLPICSCPLVCTVMQRHLNIKSDSVSNKIGQHN